MIDEVKKIRLNRERIEYEVKLERLKSKYSLLMDSIVEEKRRMKKVLPTMQAADSDAVLDVVMKKIIVIQTEIEEQYKYDKSKIINEIKNIDQQIMHQL